MNNRYNMSFAEAQEFESKIGLDVAWNDDDVYIDERHLGESVCNAARWAIDKQNEKALKVYEDFLSGNGYNFETITAELSRMKNVLTI